MDFKKSMVYSVVWPYISKVTDRVINYVLLIRLIRVPIYESNVSPCLDHHNFN